MAALRCKAPLSGTFVWHWSCPPLPDLLTNQQTAAKGRNFRCAAKKKQNPAPDGDVKTLLQYLEEQMASSTSAKKGDLNEREEVLARQISFTVHPRKNAGNQTNDKGKNPNTITLHPQGALTPG